jgi:hypothetical protein
MVDETDIFLRYFPLLAAGFAFTIDATTVLVLSMSFWVSNETLPTGSL